MKRKMRRSDRKKNSSKSSSQAEYLEGAFSKYATAGTMLFLLATAGAQKSEREWKNYNDTQPTARSIITLPWCIIQ